jgi:hypothetical protein
MDLRDGTESQGGSVSHIGWRARLRSPLFRDIDTDWASQGEADE